MRSPIFTIALSAALVVGAAASFARPAAQPAAIEDRLPPRVDVLARAIRSGFDRDEAMRLVVFMDRFWRLAGNVGFNASQDRIRERLLASGFVDRATASTATAPLVWTEEYAGSGRGWDYERGSLWIAGDAEPVLSREQQRNALCINSFSTREGGIDLTLVDVGAAQDTDFAGKAVEGAIVLGDADVATLWRAAVQARGAAGVVSTALARYVNPDPPNTATPTPREQWNVLQWGSIPYDDTKRAFAFKATPQAAARLRTRLRAGAVRVHVDIASSFSNGPARTLIAEIPGHRRPAERIVMAAHVQEPGANDDASGCATLMELARSLAGAIARGEIAPPTRTLTFLWVDEIRGSRQWLSDHADTARGVQRMFSLDMTGEDTTKTGGAFLIEKWPDPSAVWDRPSDPHSEWGRSEIKPESLKGDLLNDLHLAVSRRIARADGWVVKSNPYEGGSDHTAFGAAGIPSVLNWHFTDRYYHTNLDRPDKTSAVEMQRVATAVGVSALLLADANADAARAVAALVTEAAVARLALEKQQGETIVAGAPDRAAAERGESTILDAWTKWYEEALDSVRSLAESDPKLERSIADGKRRIRAARGGVSVRN